MGAQTVVTHDDIDRWFDGAMVAIADQLPNNENGRAARYHAEECALLAHRALDHAGVSREAPPEE